MLLSASTAIAGAKTAKKTKKASACKSSKTKKTKTTSCKASKNKKVKAKTCKSGSCKNVKAACKSKSCNNVKAAACNSGSCNNVKSAACNSGSCNNVKTAVCASGNCVNIQNILKSMGCKTNCDINSVLKTQKGYCPSGNCITKTQNPPSTVTNTDTSAKITDSKGYNSSYEDEVIALVNEQRAKYGLSVLSKDNGASQAARIRAKEIVTSFSHTRPDGSSCFTAASEVGLSYRTAGENIAFGYSTPAQVVTGWMNSEGHRKNILSSSFSKIGVGCYESGGVLYWSQFFIG